MLKSLIILATVFALNIDAIFPKMPNLLVNVAGQKMRRPPQLEARATLATSASASGPIAPDPSSSSPQNTVRWMPPLWAFPTKRDPRIISAKMISPPAASPTLSKSPGDVAARRPPPSMYIPPKRDAHTAIKRMISAPTPTSALCESADVIAVQKVQARDAPKLDARASMASMASLATTFVTMTSSSTAPASLASLATTFVTMTSSSTAPASSYPGDSQDPDYVDVWHMVSFRSFSAPDCKMPTVLQNHNPKTHDICHTYDTTEKYLAVSYYPKACDLWLYDDSKCTGAGARADWGVCYQAWPQRKSYMMKCWD